jgi:hypothetical protein
MSYTWQRLRRETMRTAAWLLGLSICGWALVVNLDPCVAGDEGWIARLEQEATKVEAACEKLDQKQAVRGELVARVRAIQDRVCKLETAHGIVPGKVSRKSDLPSLTQDLVTLATRIRQISEDGKPDKPAPSPSPKPPESDAPKPKASGEGKWPTSLTFKATARITYEETGEWFINSIRRSGLGNDFLMNGYAGTISFTVRAQGLVREIRSASMRVIVKIRSPFTRKTNVYRTYEIDWTAKQSLWNAAVKTWAKYDDLVVSGPVDWIDKPRKVTADWEAEAHVRSVTTKDGKVIQFEIPEMVPTSR